MMPILMLKNGIKVANFSSPHSFTFDDGTVLESCNETRSAELLLNKTTSLVERIKDVVDLVHVGFEINDKMIEAIHEADKEAQERGIDIVIVPLPVRTVIRENNIEVNSVFATIVMTDRVKKICSSVQFGV